MTTYLLAWFPMLLLAIGNGIFREAVLKKKFSNEKAHKVSTLTLILLLGWYVFFIVKRFPPASATQALWIGITWMLLTLVFEFSFGRYRGQSWNAMLAEYNLLNGKLWALVPLWILLAPLLFFYATQ